MTHRVLPHTMQAVGIDWGIAFPPYGIYKALTDSGSSSTAPSEATPSSNGTTPPARPPSAPSYSPSPLTDTTAQISSSATTWQYIGYGVAAAAVLGVGFYIWRSSR